MHKECVFNELSLMEFDTRFHDGTMLMEKLSTLCKIVGATQLSMWCEVKDPDTAIGRRFHELYYRRPNKVMNPDLWKKVRRVFDRAADFSAESGETSQIATELARSLSNSAGQGLARARQLRGLALSLATADHWMEAWIPAIDARTEKAARHAASEAHLAEHQDWAPLTYTERLRIALATSQPNHVDASQYKKHMNGTTNAQRQMNADTPQGASQFIAERSGNSITHAHIRAWETAVLDRVRATDDCVVKFQGGNTYHVFCDLGEIVGYEGGFGEATSWMRVEWSSGSVHSHPRRP